MFVALLNEGFTVSRDLIVIGALSLMFAVMLASFGRG